MRINVFGSRIFCSNLVIFVFSVLNFVFLTIPLSTKSLNSFQPIGTAFNSLTSESSTFVFKLFKLVATLSTSDFKAIKSF